MDVIVKIEKSELMVLQECHGFHSAPKQTKTTTDYEQNMLIPSRDGFHP
jgi:ribosome-binding protein aMBF1 (putative translation factor)